MNEPLSVPGLGPFIGYGVDSYLRASPQFKSLDGKDTVGIPAHWVPEESRSP
jgi:hypothetical protein